MKKSIKYIPIIINTLVSIMMIIALIHLDIMTKKYLLIVILVELLLNIIILTLVLVRKKVLNIIAFILSFILILFNILSISYISKTDEFISESFGTTNNTFIDTYYILVRSDSNYNELSNLENKTLGYYDNIPNIDLALNKLSELVNTKNVDMNNFTLLFNNFDSKGIDSIILEKSTYSFLNSYNSILSSDKYKVIYTFDIEIKEDIEINNDASTDYFNIYVAGRDFTDLYTDFNMIISLNMKTHKILLTSIPRDYYIELYDKGGKKDILGYSGVWGINTSVKSLENLFDIKIDYYIKINTESLVGLVDTIGGVEFCSDFAYTTTHALVLGSYNDKVGEKLYVEKGCKVYNGIQILTIARERKAYQSGDRQRQKNCQDILISIFNKIISTDTLINYSETLDAIHGLYTTNIPESLVKNFIKEVLNSKSGWEFIKQSVDGTGSYNKVHLSNYYDYVMNPDMNSVNNAKTKIESILNN